MKELTIDSMKDICRKRFTYESDFVQSTVTGPFRITLSNQFVGTLRFIVTLCPEDQLKNFLNKELPKLTLKDVKEIANIKRLDEYALQSGFIKAINEENVDYSDLELIFLFCFAYKIFLIPELDMYSSNVKTMGDFLYKTHIGSYDIKIRDRIVNILSNIDYLDWFDVTFFKKEVFNHLIREE